MAACIAASCLAVAGCKGDGERSEAEVNRLEACWRAEDWACAFDGYVDTLEQDGSIETCLADANYGCSYAIFGLYQSGVGAAAAAPPTERQAIAGRALTLLERMSEGRMQEGGEMIFNGLRYDACKRIKDFACQSDSAAMIRKAAASSGEDIDYDMSFLSEGADVTYPLDLRAVVAEVSNMEAE